MREDEREEVRARAKERRRRKKGRPTMAVSGRGMKRFAGAKPRRVDRKGRK